MEQVKTIQRKRMLLYVGFIVVFCIAIIGKLVYLMIFKSEHYTKMALEVQERERRIKAPRGKILDRNGKVIASNRTVCTVSVIYNQTKDKEKVIKVLSKELKMDEKEVRKKVEKRSSREKIKSNVSKKQEIKYENIIF